ncbi:zinc finger protein 816 isoform X2 [Aedes albopictus]|uniref:C2h2-type zn-finger protein n=1 Tax=Aedes albopictus TaxID=7160 RepID=A0ABM1Y1D1_AEDAL|nr:zinc finger protein 816-like isoform X2 [Aedes albopictus]
MANCCRICFDRQKTLLPLQTVVEFNGQELTCLQMYKSITKLEESEHNFNKISRYICISCFGELNSCYKFQQKAIESFSVLIGQISNEPDGKIEQTGDIRDCQDEQLKGEPVGENKSIHQVSLESPCLSPELKDEEYLDVDFLEEKSNHDQDKHTCTDCSEDFESQAAFDTHQVLEHYQQTDDGNCICPICHKVFNSRRCLRQHSRIHQDREARKHKCRFCEKAFNFAHHLKIHERTHTKQKPFACATCEKAFASKDRLAYHQLQHEGKLQYTCNLCATSFRSKKVLKMHSILKHDAPVEKFDPIKCDKCGKKLFSKSATSAHMRGPCGSDFAELNPGEMMFMCKMCPMKFSRLSSLKNHEKVHSVGGCYACSSCPKKYKCIESLNNHKKICHLNNEEV